MNIIGVVFARGNSQGIKNKNLLKLKKLSLVEIAVKQAYKTKIIKEVYISSDNKKILNKAKKQKAIIPFIRPKKLATNKSPEILSWRHFIRYLRKEKIKADYIVSVPTTSPLREVNDIKKCIKLAKRGDYDLIFTITKTNKSPYFNMLMRKKNSYNFLKFKKKIFRRQDSPKFYDLTTVCYVFKPDFVMRKNNLLSGKTGYVEIPKSRALDIDDKYDYKIAKLLTK
jgi:N,N'-diacetyl-8-epilegionaminate cytidylyltransferase